MPTLDVLRQWRQSLVLPDSVLVPLPCLPLFYFFSGRFLAPEPPAFRPDRTADVNSFARCTAGIGVSLSPQAILEVDSGGSPGAS